MKDAKNHFLSWLSLMTIIAAGVWLRCHGATTRSLWFDEAFTYWVSHLPLKELWNRVLYDNHPPLHYLLLHVWMGVVGNSLGALRSLGVLLGALTIVGCYLFTAEALRGRDRSSPAALPRESGLWVAAIVALSVMQIRWSWDVRMYSLGAMLTAFSSWTVVRALHARSHPYRCWLCYAFFALLLAYTHYFGLFTVAAQGLFVATQFLVTNGGFRKAVRQPAGRGAMLAATIIFLGWLPWLPIFLHQHSKLPASSWVPPLDWSSPGVLAYHWLIEPESYVPSEMVPVMVVCGLLCCAVPFALLLRRPRNFNLPVAEFARIQPPTEWYIAAAMMLPIGLAGLISIFGTRLFYSRYLIFAQLFFLVSLGWLIGCIQRPWQRRAVGGLLLLLMFGLDLRLMHHIDLEHHPSFHGVADYIESRRRSDEPVVVCSQLFYLPLRYHSGQAANWYQFGKDSRPDGPDAWTAMGAENVIAPDGMRGFTAGRAWVVNPGEDISWHHPVPVPPGWIPVRQVTFTDTYNLRTDIVVVEYDVASVAKNERD